MNCCDYKCHQGRDCPVRAERVRVAMEHLDREARRGSAWHRYTRSLARSMALTLAVMLGAAVVLSLIHH